MSKLNELIQELCPNGVEYKPLWFLTIWDKKFNSVDRHKQTKVIKYKYYLAADLKGLESQTGDVKILTTSISDLWTTEEYVKDTMSEGEIVCIPWGGNPVVQYYSGKFVTGDNRIATSANTSVLSNKFLYYFMQNRISDIASFYRGSGIKHPDMAKVLDLMIPVPPLEVQREIVRILDSFSSLTSELTEKLSAELTARKKQYEYYLRTLVSIDTHDEIVTLNEVIKKATSGSTPKKGNSDYYNNATVPWIRTQDVCFNEITSVDSYISEVAVKETSAKPIPVNCVIVAISGATAGKCAINKIEAATNQHCLNLQIDEKIALYKYVFYCVYGGYERLIGMKQGARGDLNSSLIKSLEIYLPSLEEQQRIVDVLDRFDSLCNDLSNGLPAEIEARKKQYEYYRDKLLTFKQL